MGMIGFPVVLIALQPALDPRPLLPLSRGHVLRRYQTETVADRDAVLPGRQMPVGLAFSEAVSESVHQDFPRPGP